MIEPYNLNEEDMAGKDVTVEAARFATLSRTACFANYPGPHLYKTRGRGSQILCSIPVALPLRQIRRRRQPMSGNPQH